MATIFTKIIDGELPGRFVWRDEKAVAFLTINPLNPGHTLVVPRQEVDHWLDLEPALLAHLTSMSHTIAGALQRTFKPTKVGLIIAGLEVPHVHIHLIPIDKLEDLSFARAEKNPDPKKMDEAAQRIRTALRETGVTQASD